jgi:hypothetical protein
LCSLAWLQRCNRQRNATVARDSDAARHQVRGWGPGRNYRVQHCLSNPNDNPLQAIATLNRTAPVTRPLDPAGRFRLNA